MPLGSKVIDGETFVAAMLFQEIESICRVVLTLLAWVFVGGQLKSSFPLRLLIRILYSG